MSHKISILMPVYNGMPLIQASVDSILSQTYTNWECIIVNDGSTDGTTKYLDTLKDSRFIIHHFKTNMGRPIARQKSLDLASGEFIAMLDAEDLYSRNKLKEQVDYLLEHPEVSMVSSSMCSFGTKTDLLRKRGSESIINVVYDDNKIPNHASSMLRTEIAKAISYNPLMKLGQDRDFLERYLNGRLYTLLPNIHYYYSEYDSVTKRKIRKTYKLNIQKYYRSHNLKSMTLSIAKLIYSYIVYPFVPVYSIISKRGKELTDKEFVFYKRECKDIVDKYL